MRHMIPCFAAITLASGVAGCGPTGVTEGTVPFKETDTKQFDQMKADMIKNLGHYSKPKAKKAKAGGATTEPSKD